MTGLKKNLSFSVKEKRSLIEPGHAKISIVRQCRLIGLTKSAYYYRPHGESAFNLALMRLIDAQYTRTPYYGTPKMTAWLGRMGYKVNPKRVRRLMRLMGLMAVYPKPWLSTPDKEHKKYPYLLRGLKITRHDQVWSTDITFIRLFNGFIYLVAVMDWYSRYVLSWELSTTLDKEFCIKALDDALKISTPDIFNTDQGSQFTSAEFTGRLEDEGIKISMDGRGRALDNIFVERLWRTVKYEEVYLKSYRTVEEARASLDVYFRSYNRERIHESLDYRTPFEVYFDKETELPNPVKADTIHLIQPDLLS